MEREKCAETILNDGREAALGWLGPDDAPAVVALGQGLASDEAGYLSVALDDARAVEAWLSETPASGRKVLGAWEPGRSDQLHGFVSLEPGRGAHRHIGRLEAFLHPEMRELGLGSNLIKEAASQATVDGLMLLELEVHVKQRGLINAFKNLGFELKAIIEAYRVDTAGEPYDVIIMLKRLAHVATKDFLHRF